jgi:DNA-binding MarR family transcriptional regulator
MTDGTRWEHVEQPILEALAAGDGVSMSDQELHAATGIDDADLMRSLRSLKEDDYIDAVLVQPDQADYPVRAAGVRLLPKGLRQAGLWPAEDFASAFMAALESAIGEETDPQRRSNLERLLNAAKTVGNMTLSAAIANAIGIGRSHLGLG